MRSFLLVLFLVLGHGQATVAEAEKPNPSTESVGQKPNIIFIVCDDLGYGDLGCFGQERIKTPNLDRLAREGLKFTDHYSGHTVCRPSRLVYLTGKHSGNTAIAGNVGYALPAGTVTVGHLMQRAGYRTGAVGKWALGGVGSPGHPNRQGFDFWYGYLDQGEAHNYYPEFLFRNETKEVLPGNKLGDQKRVSVKRETWSHDLITKEALGFIERNADGPFFLNIAWTVPHANNEGGRATGNGMEVPDYSPYEKEDWPDTAKGQAAMITRMDADVGRLVALLKKLGIEQRTLIFFSSDNGPHSEGGHKHEFFDANGPLRGYKRDLYDGGIRAPTIAWWPGTVKPGVTGHISAFWDMLPTACDLAGVPAPPDTDGISFAPILSGAGQQQEHDYLFWLFAKGKELDKGKAAVRQGKWKAVKNGPGPLELYDLSADIGEQKNLADLYPEKVHDMMRIIRNYVPVKKGR